MANKAWVIAKRNKYINIYRKYTGKNDYNNVICTIVQCIYCTRVVQKNVIVLTQQ